MGDAAAASPQGKRRRGGAEGMRRVAEIVMVLAAAGEVRGGREPTAAERALTAEARERLAAAVAGAGAGGAVRPRDLFPGDAVRAVVEDLGLNRARDPAAMGFRPPKASIADRLMLTKRKMEEVKEVPVPVPPTAQAAALNGMTEFQAFHGSTMFAAGAARNPPAVASLPASASASTTSVVISKPPGSSPVKPVTSPSVVALPHTGQPHLKSDKGVNGPLNVTRSGVTVGHLNKSLHDTSARSNVNSVQSSNLVVKNQDTKAVSPQAATGNPVSSKPTFIQHNEIAKSVQHFLHEPANHSSWTPPSTEYMHARLDCQICKVAIMDMDSLLVCDACERGAHLKCLQYYGNKGVPKAEWHCPTCLSQSKGKPLPPKYGKVTRTVAAPKNGSPGGVTQLSAHGVTENLVARENHEKVAANGNLMKPKSMQTGSTVHKSTVLALTSGTAGSHSQSISASRPAKESVNNAETSFNGKEGNEQICGSTAWHSMKPLYDVQSGEFAAGSYTGMNPEKSPNENVSSGLSSYSLDSLNDAMHGQQSSVISGIKLSSNSFLVAAEAKTKFEPHSEALLSQDVEMDDNNGTPMDQTSDICTEEKIGTRATSGPDAAEVVERTTNTGTPIDDDSNVAIEEKVHAEATSEPCTIKDMEMTPDTGMLVYEDRNVSTVKTLQRDAAPGSHTIDSIEMAANAATTIDQSGFANEEKPQPEPTSAVKGADMTTNSGILTDKTQQANDSAENGGREPPKAEAYEDKSDWNAMSEHNSTQQVIPNGMLHPKDDDLCSWDGEVMVCGAAPREEAK